MSKTKRRPEGCEDDHLEFLDRLRESGVTNMFGAWKYVESVYGFSKKKASAILIYWMETFGQDDR